MESLPKVVEKIDTEYVYNGLSVESVSSGRLRFVRKFHKLFRFVDGYLPAEVKPIVPFDFVSLFTFSEEGHSMQTSGVNSTAISLAKPWATVEASFDDAKKEPTTTKKVRSYYTERLICDKVYLSIDPEQIIPDYGFIQKVKAAVANKENEVDKYQALVEVLNEWGWYVPLKFTLGSFLYATKIKEVDSLDQAKTESANFSANFNAEFKRLATGEGDSTGPTGKTTIEKEQIVFFQNGGSIIGKDNFRNWVDSLDDEKTWELVGYTKLYPSLMLLNNKEDATLGDCLGVLRKFYSNKYVKDLQKYISVKDYEYEISKVVSPVYD